MSKQKKCRTKEPRRDILLGRITIGLWIAAIAWMVAISFYIGVTERYFSELTSGILIFIPWTLITAAILLRAWQKYGKRSKSQFYTQLAIWGIAWVVWLFKSIINRL